MRWILTSSWENDVKSECRRTRLLMRWAQEENDVRPGMDDLFDRTFAMDSVY
jgi:hypothetical protein